MARNVVRSALVPSVLALVLSAAPVGASLQGPAEVEVTHGLLSHRVALAPGEKLLAYAFDGRAEIPWCGGPDPELVHGAVSPTATTRAYFFFEGLGELATSGLRALAFQGIRRAPGRRGAGLGFLPTSRIELGPAGIPKPTESWTLELWILPIGPFASGTHVAELRGAALLTLRVDGRLEASLSTPGAPVVTSAQALTPWVWAHVGLSLDATDLDHLRLTVDGAPAVRGVAGFVPPPFQGELLLGDGAANGRGFLGILDEVHLRAHPTTSQEMVEHGDDRAAAGPHTLTLRTSLGTRRIELWHEPFAGAVMETAGDFAQGVLDHALHENGGVILAGADWERLEVGDAPAARTTHPSVFVGNHRVLIFGGETRDTQFGPFRNTDDTWILDTLAQRWTRVDTPVAPAPRCHQSAAYSPDHDLVLYYGGFRNDVTPTVVYDDTWLFDVGSGTWSPRNPAGFVPGSHSDSAVFYHPLARKFVVFLSRRVLTYDPTLDRWDLLPLPTVVDEAGAPIPGTFQMGGSGMTGYDPVTNRAVVFGGSQMVNGVREYLDVTYLYELETNTFTVLDPPEKPAARVRAGFAYDPKRVRFVMFGGVLDQFSTRFDDLWSFDPRSRLWVQHDASNAPSARGGYFDMAYDPALERFFLPCGRSTPQDFHNETWSLDFSPDRPGSVQELFDRSGLGASTQWFADVENHDDSHVDMLFRSSFDGLLFGAWTPDPAVALAGDPRYLMVEATLYRASTGARPRVLRMGFR